MKYFALLAILVVGLALTGCGSNDNSKASNVDGTWNASLVSSGDTPVLTFGTSITSNGDGSLTITSFSFTDNTSCFSSETESGSFTLSGNVSGNVSGKFGMNVQSVTPSGNTLALTGTVNGNTISGNWTLTGSSGCTGSGTFTMNKM
jgi:hypothetical protein